MTDPTASTSRAKATVTVVVLVILAAALIVGLGLPGDEPGGAPSAGDAPSTAAVEVDGQPLPPLQDPATDPALGQAAPTVSGQGFDGQSVTLGERGPAAIVLLAHWCPHCQNEVPAVQAWLDEGGLPDGVDLVAVSTGVDEQRGNYPPAAWLEREGWQPDTLVDDAESSAATAFGLTGYPMWVFVDGNGAVVGRIGGALPIEQLEQVLGMLAAQP